MAREDVAATAFSGKLTLNGWFPPRGRAKSITEDLGGCGPTPIVVVSLFGAGILGALLVGWTALRGCAGLELAGGKFRTTGAISPLGSELTSVLTAGLDSIVGDESESVGRISAEPAYGGLSLDSSSEGVTLSSLFVPAASPELSTVEAGFRGVDSSV